MSLIRDGKGKAYSAEVDSTNKLQTRAVSKSRFNDVSDTDGRAFRMVTDFVTVSAGVRSLVFYFKNTSTTRNFRVQALYISWNGGSTNFDRPLKAELRGSVAEPSANNTSITAFNLNSTSGITGSDLTSYYWNGVGTGMTTSFEGGLAGAAIFKQGLKVVSPDGAIIMGTDGSLGVFMESPEAGEVAIFAEGYFEDKNGD